MRPFTQTVTASEANGWCGNCWQTAIACLLEVDPEELPAQDGCDKRVRLADATFEHVASPDYQSRLGAYLRKHHDLAYLELHSPDELFPRLRVADPGWHIMTGATVRSVAMGGLRHVVVGHYGQVAWDPHPSHAGLLEEGVNWALLIPFPKSWAKAGFYKDPCVCPACMSTASRGGAP